MCGIAGMYGRARADRATLLEMAGELHHRGPDGAALYLDGAFGMVNTRLAIVDLTHGDQPLANETGRLWAMQNGEIFNHVELRAQLTALGHHFRTTCDTEIIPHAYEEWGIDCLRRFNGDFAIALWDRDRRELILARDRFGVRPLFLATYGEDVCFASEAKALLRHPRASRELDPSGLVDTFTLWSTLPDRSAFKGVSELPAAHYVRIGPGGAEPARCWWDLQFEAATGRSEADYADELEALLSDSIRLRLRADVPVATYLSGGLDSSAIAAIAAGELPEGVLHAFGVGFTDAHFDESPQQDAIAARIGTEFHRTMIDSQAISDAFARVVELAEKPVLRTAPAPMLHLSRAVRESGLKVVLTGEGADELFAGYDIFREDKVRRFWARHPESTVRPQLLARLNRFLATDPARAGAFMNRFYARGLTDTDDPLYSHRLRFLNTGRTVGLLDRDFLARADAWEPRLLDRLPETFSARTPLARAQYLEIKVFLEGYLLHSQGDRMLMGNSVEGRFPFLDHRLAEFAATLPDSLRLRGLTEKYLLRRAVAKHLPPAIHGRAKVPYRAPIRDAFFGARRPEYVDELLSPGALAAAGVLEPAAVARVVAKFRREGGMVSETDEMALVASISTMLLHERLVARPALAPAATPSRVVVGSTVTVDHAIPTLAEAA